MMHWSIIMMIMMIMMMMMMMMMIMIMMIMIKIGRIFCWSWSWSVDERECAVMRWHVSKGMYKRRHQVDTNISQKICIAAAKGKSSGIFLNFDMMYAKTKREKTRTKLASKEPLGASLEARLLGTKLLSYIYAQQLTLPSHTTT